ncbi:MAG: hypothetical protein NC235_13180 [Clostridiales bacterium]|nr:hypothetical protein [Clostridiales bacterium]
MPDFCLSYEENMVFHQFYSAVLSRRAKRIITYYRKKLEQSFNNNVLLKDQFEDEKKLDSIYNYGEMFRVIHHATRLEIMSKEMIKAILACYSFILPRIFDEYIVEYLESLNDQLKIRNISKADYENFSAQNKIKILNNNGAFKGLREPELLYKIFGNTLLGNWNYDLFSGEPIYIKFKETVDDINQSVNELKYLLDMKSSNTVDEILDANDKEKVFEKIKERIFTGKERFILQKMMYAFTL